MRPTMFRILGAALIAALALSPACSPPAEAQQKMINLNMGSTSSTSAVYAWCVATANVINKANLGLNVTVIESGAALDNLRKLKDGSFDFALSIDIPSAMQMSRASTRSKASRGRTCGCSSSATSPSIAFTCARTPE